VLRLDVVALGASRAVHDDVGSLYRNFDSLALGKVTCHELDPLSFLVAAPAEHSDLAPGVPQPGDYEPPQSACATGDQDGCRYAFDYCHGDWPPNGY
jgi:hypothetical protein